MRLPVLALLAAALQAGTTEEALVELGRRLFFDPRLSADGTVSCASCHRPEHGFADPRPVSTGVYGRQGRRNAPTLLNKDRQRRLFWDGRASSLEEQALGPLFSPHEMGNTAASLLERMAALGEYRPLFEAAFGSPEPSVERITRALTAFERSLARRDSLWDLWAAGDKGALHEEAERGRLLFFGKARCHLCHSGPDFTNGDFVNIGAGGRGSPDGGRFEATHQPGDWRLFQTPSLREVARTAPYMHDGSLATLEEVIEFYDRGGDPAENKDYRIIPLHLTEQEKRDLLAFLRALSSTAGIAVQPQTAAPEQACFPVEALAGPDRELAESLFLRLMDSEALYTAAGGAKPASSGFVRFQLAEGSPLDAIDRVRRVLEAFRCGGDLLATVHRFQRTYPDRNGKPSRFYEGIVMHRSAVRRTVERHRAFFASLGVSPHSHPLEVLMAVEDAPDESRWRGYGYLFGYPDEAVEFFVAAGIREKQEQARVPRRFISMPTFARAERGVVYAVAEDAEESEQDRRLRQQLERILAEYRERRQRHSEGGRVDVLGLLRAWFDPGRTSRLALVSPE